MKTNLYLISTPVVTLALTTLLMVSCHTPAAKATTAPAAGALPTINTSYKEATRSDGTKNNTAYPTTYKNTRYPAWPMGLRLYINYLYGIKNGC